MEAIIYRLYWCSASRMQCFVKLRDENCESLSEHDDDAVAGNSLILIAQNATFGCLCTHNNQSDRSDVCPRIAISVGQTLDRPKLYSINPINIKQAPRRRASHSFFRHLSLNHVDHRHRTSNCGRIAYRGLRLPLIYSDHALSL